MTTTVIKDSYQFNAKVQSKGKQRGGEGWTLTLDWKLPGSKFELVLYGQEWEDVEMANVGALAYFDIAQGNLKAEKTGKYASDYFWNLAAIGEPQVGAPLAAPSQDVDAPHGPVTQGNGQPWQKPPPEYRQPTGQDALQQRIAWNSAINNATNLLAYASNLMFDQSTEAEVLKWAAWYYQAITSGPPPHQGQDGATEAAAPQGAATPSETPAQAQEASFAALSAFNGAWKAALARHQWPTEQEGLAAVEGYIARNYQGRKLRQLSDAEVGGVTGALRQGKL